MTSKEKYYRDAGSDNFARFKLGEAERQHFLHGEWIEDELDLPPAPDWRYTPPPAATAPRVEAFVDWCIDHQVGLSVALWAAIIAAGVAIWQLW